MKWLGWLVEAAGIAAALAILGTAAAASVLILFVNWWAGLVVLAVPAALLLGAYSSALMVAWRDWRELRPYR